MSDIKTNLKKLRELEHVKTTTTHKYNVKAHIIDSVIEHKNTITDAINMRDQNCKNNADKKLAEEIAICKVTKSQADNNSTGETLDEDSKAFSSCVDNAETNYKSSLQTCADEFKAFEAALAGDVSSTMSVATDLIA